MNLLETNRLLLRTWKSNDYLDYYEFVSDNTVAYNAGFYTATDIEQCKKDINIKISSNQSCAIVLKSENKVIGSIGIDNIILDKSLEDLNQRYIGFMLNSKYWGYGYATEATKIFIKHLLENLNLDLIWCSHYDFNLRSKRVIEKCGFNYKFSRNAKFNTLENKPVIEIFYNLFKD